VDGLAEFVQSIVDLMNGITLGDLIVGSVLSMLVLPIHVFVHEIGHAVTAWLLGHRVHELRVGDDDPTVTVRSGSFVMRLGRLTGGGDYGGYVVYDGTRASAWHELLISAAGPLASIAFGLLAGFAVIANPSHWFVLFMVLVAGLEIGVANLSANAPDGQSVRRSWRRIRSPEAADPHEATSVAPPGY
jgi:membrane-associated protease RseP (regulator of RpoE activity)